MFADRFKKKATNNREAFLRPRILQPAIKWLDVRESAWGTDEERAANQFSFLQGDLVESRFGYGLDGITNHSIWMILSPDCDAVRGRFVRVGVAYPIFKSMTNEDRWLLKYKQALAFRNSKLFSVPWHGNHPELRGYCVDLESPHYLRFDLADTRELVTQLASLTGDGWHILNSLLQEQTTRASVAEGLHIRNSGVVDNPSI